LIRKESKMENQNTLNGVRPGVVDGQENPEGGGSEGRESEAAGAAEVSDNPSPARKGQSPGENAGFARLRRENDALKKELEKLKTGTERPEGPDPLALERERYRRAAFEARYDADLREIRAAFPKEKIGHVRELGRQYFALRRCGVDNLVAYSAVRAAAAASKKAPPPDIGPVGSGETSREFFTREELDRLSDKELSDPKVLEKAVKSLSKLKKRQ
jgi:hypothetical protein